ncbi:hypothetical protein T12_5119 [Trichinella patagoniensis]|uniref:Uncharacterized protein n=1 Tax=Trichinella patagoniensis TaxID=990121 RepID=A0A0V1A8V4_9BILA|nr:hypothetical protein T12_5119 [Trichinella patagoniensis]
MKIALCKCNNDKKPSTAMIRKCDHDQTDENVTWNSLKMPATVCMKCTAHLLNIMIPCSVDYVKSCSDMMLNDKETESTGMHVFKN